MNQQDKIELSKQVAKKYGIEAYVVYGCDAYGEPLPFTWLVDDDTRCFRLAVDNGIGFDQTHDEMYVSTFSVRNFKIFSEAFADHSDKYEATRIAILKCLDAMKQ